MGDEIKTSGNNVKVFFLIIKYYAAFFTLVSFAYLKYYAELAGEAQFICHFNNI